MKVQMFKRMSEFKRQFESSKECLRVQKKVLKFKRKFKYSFETSNIQKISESSKESLKVQKKVQKFKSSKENDPALGLFSFISVQLFKLPLTTERP